MKTRLYLPAVLLLLSLQAGAAFISERPPEKAITEMTEAEKKILLTEIKQRISEIRDMDKSQLTRAERKELRKELKELKAQATAARGIYLSIGAIIIIILLLILIL